VGGVGQLSIAKALVAFFFILVIAVSFAAVIHMERTAALSFTATRGLSQRSIYYGTAYNPLTFPMFTHQLPTFLNPSILDINVAETSASVFNNTTRVEIYDFIKANPGVQFRGICNQLGLSIGLAEFHLGVLKRAGLISFIRDGRYKRFFESKKFSQKETEIISLLRHDATKSIIETVLEEKRISHGKLAHQLSITSQGLTWQMNRLKNQGIIRESKDDMKKIYSLDEAYAPILTEIITLMK
jgi:DNA-binding transcriptional ArsR family regulator